MCTVPLFLSGYQSEEGSVCGGEGTALHGRRSNSRRQCREKFLSGESERGIYARCWLRRRPTSTSAFFSTPIMEGDLALSKKETIRRARDLVHHLGNDIQQWEDLYDQFEQNSRASEERLDFLKSRLDFCERELVEKEKKLESCEIKCRNKENELLSLCESFDERRLKIKEKEKELLSLQQSVEESELDFRREDEKLGFLMNTMDSLDEQISQKEEKLGLIEGKILKREMHCRKKDEELISMGVAAEKLDSEIKGKENEVQLLQNSISELHTAYVSKKEAMEAQHAFDVALKRKELDCLQLKMDVRSKELSTLENSFADCSKRIELDLITKRAVESTERQSHQQQESYPTGSATSSCGTQIKIEPPDFPIQGHIFPIATNYQFPIFDQQIQSQMIQGELERLNIDTITDLAKLTLADIDASYGQHLIRQGISFDAEKMKEHINLLERIASPSTPITHEVKQGAMVLANKWVMKLRTPSFVHHLEVLGFFSFLAAYKLVSEFSQSEILWFIQAHSLDSKAPQLCKNILQSGNVVPSPLDLLQQKGNKKRPSDSGLLDEQGSRKTSTWR